MLSEHTSEVRQKRASLIKATENLKKVVAKRKHSREEFEVESISSHTVRNKKIIYSVTWVGYPGEVTELTEDELKNSQELLQEYKRKLSIGISEETKASSQHSVLPSERDERRSTSMKGRSERLLSSSPTKHVEKDSIVDDTVGNTANTTFVNSTQQTKEKKTNGSTSHVSKPNGNTSNPPNKRARKAKYEIALDAQLGYTNGCIVDTYKGFSSNYAEPVVLVSYKEPLPCGFESKQDEIVPIRLIAEVDPQRLITHLVGLLTAGRQKATI